MTEETRQLISRIRSALNKRDDAPCVGDIRNGNDTAHCDIKQWQAFLAECDGGRFGAIDLWSSNELESYQDTFLSVEEPDNYLVVGQILYEPVAIKRSTSMLFWLPRNAPAISLGSADNFVRHFIFGSGYSEIVPNAEDEPWWQFLQTETEIADSSEDN